MGMKFLVTGANGLIGRAMLNRSFMQPDVQVFGCARPRATDEAPRRIVDGMVPQ